MRLAVVAVPILAALPISIVDADDGPPTSVPASDVGVAPVDRALDDVMSWLESPATVDAERFTDTFLASVPIEEVNAAFEDLGDAWVVESVEHQAADELVATIHDHLMTLELFVAVDGSGLIDGLGFELGELVDPPVSLSQVAEQVDGFGSSSALLVAEIDDGGVCRPITALNEESAMPLGSVFKLYVLGAVATAVDEGSLGWEDPVVIRDELDSLPSGVTQDEPDGSTISVSGLASRMISISDNTATDHLIDLVGREQVEGALAAFGHSDPTITVPFLTTRELFILRMDPELLERYSNADESGRRALLAEEIAGRPLPTGDWTEPREVTTVEWFATPTDICQALVALDDLGDDPDLAPVRTIMTSQEDLPIETDFARLLYKPGGEPGVQFDAWLAVTDAGRRYAVVGGAASETEPIHPALYLVIVRALDLLPT
jgi:hypothetical protein